MFCPSSPPPKMVPYREEGQLLECPPCGEARRERAAAVTTLIENRAAAICFLKYREAEAIHYIEYREGGSNPLPRRRGGRQHSTT